jgi:hypothetical protein
MKRCFVISPIGSEDSAVREHADDVFDYIIAPAMKRHGIEPFRSDHLLEHGKITDQMFGAILNYDLCVAVLTGYNPNVFYEMAIAQCAARPVIMLIEKGRDLPFDIRDQRCVSYTLKPRPLFEGVYVNEIAAHIESLERINWKVTVPFGVLTPLGGRDADESRPRFLERAMDFGRADDRLRLLQETEQVFEVMGMNQNGWLRIRGFQDLLIRKLAAGCKVRVLIMHQDNPALKQFVNDAIPELTYDQAVSDIKSVYQYFQKLADTNPNIEVRQILRGCLHTQLTRTDQQAIMTQYLYSRRPGWSPLWQCARNSSLYEMVAEEFQTLWEANGPPPAPVPLPPAGATPARSNAQPRLRPRRGITPRAES